MNLTAIQTWAIVIQTGVFAAQTYVLGKTLATVKKQTAAANAQAEAAENQANVALKQMYANIAQQDQSVPPLITLERTSHDGDDRWEFLVRNDGLGPAFAIHAFLEETVVNGKTLERRPLTTFMPFLGVGRSIELTAPKKAAFQM